MLRVANGVARQGEYVEMTVREYRELMKAGKIFRCQRHGFERPATAKPRKHLKPKPDPKPRPPKVERFRGHCITRERYMEMEAEQGFACAICKSEHKSMDLLIDHCHGTGVIRGLLCRRCNVGIGYFSDDPKLMQRAIYYLLFQKQNTETRRCDE